MAGREKRAIRLDTASARNTMGTARSMGAARSARPRLPVYPSANGGAFASARQKPAVSPYTAAARGAPLEEMSVGRYARRPSAVGGSWETFEPQQRSVIPTQSNPVATIRVRSGSTSVTSRNRRHGSDPWRKSKRSSPKCSRQWRNSAAHRSTQALGRSGVFADYRLRVASVVRDYGMFEREQAPQKYPDVKR